MSPFDFDPYAQYGFGIPDQEDQGVPVPAAPGLVANAPTPGFLDRLKGLFMPSQAQAAEPQGGGMDMGALLPGMILTQLGQQMQLPRNQRNPAAIPQAIMGVIKAQQGSQEEKQKLAMQKLLFLNELQKGKTPLTIEAALIKAQAEGKSPEELEQIANLKRKLEKPTEEKVPTTIPAAILQRKSAGQPYDDLLVLQKQLEKEPTPHPTLLEDEEGNLVPWLPGQSLAGLKKPVSSAYTTTPEDQEAIIDGLKKGLIDPNQLSKRGINPILGKASKEGLNIGQMKLDWRSANELAGTMNRGQMVRFDTLTQTVMGTIDRVIDLSKKLEMSGVPLANAAKLGTIRNIDANSPTGQLIGEYMAAITTLKEEYANFAQGGYAPTESSFKLSNALINENYGSKQMQATLEETKRLVNIRRQAFKNVTAQKIAGPGQDFLQPSGGSVPSGNVNLKTMSTEELIRLRDQLKGGR